MRSYPFLPQSLEDDDPATIPRTSAAPTTDNAGAGMEEISLTGGTMLPNNHNNNAGGGRNHHDGHNHHSHQHAHNTHHISSSSASGTNQNEMAASAQALNQFHAALSQQQQAHALQHKDCCGSPKPAAAMPVIRLNMPPADMVRQQSTAQLLAAVKIVTKMGQFATLQEIVTAWKEYKGEAWVEARLRGFAGNDEDEYNGDGSQLQPHDAEGHTNLHWAAKRTEDVQFVQFWAPYIAVTIPTTDSTGMTPLHWACTEPNSFTIIHFLLNYVPNGTEAGSSNKSGLNSQQAVLECRDGSGCTPLLLAAQHGHVETVAYLVHEFGASLHAVDDSGDSATHWAAYKGSAAVLGLLAYYEKQDDGGNNGSSSSSSLHMLEKPDAYGQTPLHLAALRGHSSACQYILKQISGGSRAPEWRRALALLNLPDKNGRTPYQLAVHKQKPHTAAVLQQAKRTLSLSMPRNSNDAWAVLQTVVADWLCNGHFWKMWLGIPTGLDDPMDVAPSFPLYYVYANVLLNLWFHYTVFCPLLAADLGSGVLWDCTVLHILQLLLSIALLYSLYQTQTTNPGKLDDSCPEIGYWRRLYGETLTSYANANNNGASDMNRYQWQLCHTCHIARPPRSKHDRSTGACVLMFDHACPFVGNTIGLYNYKWFYAVLLTMTWYFLNHIVLLCKYIARKHWSNVPTWVLVMGIYLSVHILMAGSMWIYHTQLIVANLTTNEHLGMQKYDYLWTATRDSNGNGGPVTRTFKNPWQKGPVGNLMDRLFPSHNAYLLPELQERLLSSKGNPAGGSGGGMEMV